MNRTRHIELKVGESMRVGAATLTLVEKSGQRAKLKVFADESVKVEHPIRQEPSLASRGVMVAAPT